MSRPIYGLTIRALLGQRRTLALVLLSLAPVLMALVFSLAADADADPYRFYSRLVQRLFIPVITALVALIVGVSAIGDEREDGTILYLAATPLPRLGIVVAKILAAWTVCLALLVPSVVVCGLLALTGDVTIAILVWPALGVALAALAYCAVGGWLSLQVRRPIVVGVIYILLWEGSIATYAASADRLSIAAYGRALVAEQLPQSAAGVVSPATAAIVLIAATVAGALLGARAMTRAELPVRNPNAVGRRLMGMRHLTIIAVFATLALAGCGSATGSSADSGEGRRAPARPASRASSKASPAPTARPWRRCRMPVSACTRKRSPWSARRASTSPTRSPRRRPTTQGASRWTGLAPGRYFVVAATASHWVQVTDGSVARASFAVCRDCAVPL